MSSVALPFYYRKNHPELFSPIRHAVLPTIGVLWILVPLWYLAKPGQSTPYNWYPYMALGVIVLALIYATFLCSSRSEHRRPRGFHCRRRVEEHR